MRGSGGTEGGLGMFAFGFALAIGALYFFFDSVTVSTESWGVFTGLARRGANPDGMWSTTSMGLLFVPFFLGVIALFYNAQLRWAWWLMWIGVGILVVEILSRIRFLMATKMTHLLGMIVMFAAGVGIMLRSYREVEKTASSENEDATKKSD